ncbi:MAG: MCE family protein [Spirochaetes bacterium]|nr:MCE family protein [Spirochaetota bacterium]
MKFNRNEIRVIIFILIPVIVILLFVLLKLGYSIASTTIDVYLKVDNINSIKNGTQVKVKGYTIGRVIEIRPVYKPALHFLAVMRLRRDIDIYEDCSAIIQNQNIIGEPVIEIRNPGKKGELITDDSVIEGVDYVNLESLLNEAHKLLANLSGTVDVLRGMSLESKNNIRLLIANLSSSATAIHEILRDSQKDLGTTLQSFRQTALILNEISKELKKHPVKFLFKGKDEKENR